MKFNAKIIMKYKQLIYLLFIFIITIGTIIIAAGVKYRTNLPVKLNDVPKNERITEKVRITVINLLIPAFKIFPFRTNAYDNRYPSRIKKSVRFEKPDFVPVI